jgi:serine/threonine protein kinase
MAKKPADIKLILAEASEKTSIEERTEYLTQTCGDNVSLRQEVESLLKMEDRVGDFLESPILDSGVILDESPLSEGPGTVIGRYKLLEKIGEGGMAVVYMAEQTEPIRRRVALKIIKLGMDTKSVIARFEAERQVLAMMDHPNIARVFDAGVTESGRPYFVMELVKGTSITDFCDMNNLSTQERLELFIQICKAVQHAHQKGIIHRDIKPTNIMVTLYDGKPVPKVIDFGVAKAINRQLTEKTLFTRYAQIIGTPAYMSPEQAEMSGLDIDIRTDVFSLGTLLYELLTGSTPFDSDYLHSKGYGEIQRIIREEEPTKPSTKISTLGAALIEVAKYRNTSPDELRKQISSDLDWIVMKTLEKDRNRRYDSASEFAAEIRRYLNNEPVLAGPPSALYRVRKFVQRRRTLVSAIAIISVVIVTGFLVSTAMYLQAENARQEETEARAEAQNVIDFLTNDLLASVYPENAKQPEVTVSYILENASEKLDERFINSPLAEAIVCDALAMTYKKMGRYSQAEPHMKRALEIRRTQLGDEHSDTLASIDRLGWLYRYQGRNKEAERLLMEIFEQRRRILGPEHPDTLESMSHLAWCEWDKWNGLEFIKKTHVTTQRLLGQDHPITLEATMALANNYISRFELEKAQAIVPDAYERSRHVLGEEHETTLALMNTLVWMYDLQERADKGAPLAEKAYEITLRTFGEKHFLTIHAMCNLGSIYALQSRYEEADSLLNQAIRLGRQHLGEKHIITLCGLLKLGYLYRKQGRNDEHDILFINLLELCRRKYSEDSMFIRFPKYGLDIREQQLSELAEQQKASGDHKGAATTLKRLEEIQQTLKGNSETNGSGI